MQVVVTVGCIVEEEAMSLLSYWLQNWIVEDLTGCVGADLNAS